MNVLLVGSGGREHAIAWKLAQSPRLTRLYIAPGNPGMASLGENLAVKVEDIPSLVQVAREKAIDLVVVGPEVPLIMGLTDALQAAGLRVFGPTQAAAQIEGSKAFSKAFMERHAIPSARYATFNDYDSAAAHLKTVAYPVVLKADGLAAGKGVILPETQDEALVALRGMLLDDHFGAAGRTVVIEERLEGEEVSLLAFSDGQTVRAMPPAQDHKRLLDGDLGPNTGGMGAYAPAPVCPPEMVAELIATVLQPAIDGLRAEGTPFVGVLYAGMMLTPRGLRTLEFNCRFGDPETQVILPLLDCDLLEILDACAAGTLEQVEIRWKTGSCACVVVASEAYPQSGSSGLPITGLEAAPTGTAIFQAGTRMQRGQVVTSGGRVLGVSAWGSDLRLALRNAYAAVKLIHFQGMQYRKDIGHRALALLPEKPVGLSYADSGVDIDAGNRAVKLMSAAVRSTYTPAVLAGIGAFGGLFDAAALRTLHRPVLVASTDGVGTKVKLAAQANRYHGIGQDIVNHCINDILVQGARPLFFLDYFATSHLQPEVIAEIVSGISTACKAAGCVLLGGETAEMPGVYTPGEFDVAGTIVGMVDYERILPRPDLQPGDLLVGLPSSGPHTNGYSLIRRVFQDVDLNTFYPELGGTLADALLAPHRSYLNWLQPALDLNPCPIKALAHLTGGGFIENIPRILPAGVGVQVNWNSWPVPPLFRLIQSQGQIEWSEMARTFNLGIGMVVVIAPADLDRLQATLPEPGWVIGVVVAGDKKVTLQ
jgi:phosphoribosylamine--glycine ligase/phosphoribosylformylglycinamidine cyclo-ligase